MNSLEATDRVKVDGGIRDSMLIEDWLDSMEFQVLEPWSKQRDPEFHLHKEQWLGIQTDNAREQQSQRFPVIEK